MRGRATAGFLLCLAAAVTPSTLPCGDHHAVTIAAGVSGLPGALSALLLDSLTNALDAEWRLHFGLLGL